MKFFSALFFLLASIAVISLLFWEPHVEKFSDNLSDVDRLNPVESQVEKKPDIEISTPLFITGTKPKPPAEKQNVSEIIQSSLMKPDEISNDGSLLNSSRTVEAIQAELDTLPLTSDFAAARTVLLNAASTLPMDDQEIVDQVHDMALQELFDSSVQGLGDTNQVVQEGEGLKSFSSFLPVVAHEILLRTADSEQEALIVTIEGMAYQQDSGVRQSLLKQFLQYYPASANTIAEELINRNLIQQSAVSTADFQ